MSGALRVRRALLILGDKRGAEELARHLHEHGAELPATGGARRLLEQVGLPVREVAAHAGFPEILDGRVKTLHPRRHGMLP